MRGKRTHPPTRGLGKGRRATPSTVDGIEFKSKLEADTYRMLKEAGLEFEYEAHSFSILDPGQYKGLCMEFSTRGGFKDRKEYRGIVYTPDFVGIKDGWIIECKGHPNERFPLVWKMFKVLMAEVAVPGHKRVFDLYVPRNLAHVAESIQSIKQRRLCLM